MSSKTDSQVSSRKDKINYIGSTHTLFSAGIVLAGYHLGHDNICQTKGGLLYAGG